MKWEYRTLILPTKGFFGGKVPEAALNAALAEAGEDGWELVAALDTNRDQGSTKDLVLIFKRPA